MLKAMNSQLPNLGPFGSVPRPHLFASDWQLPSPGSLVQPPDMAGLLGAGVGAAGPMRLPGAVGQEPQLRLNEAQQALWQEEMKAAAAQQGPGAGGEQLGGAAGGVAGGNVGGESSSWLLDMLGKVDAASHDAGAAAAASAPQHFPQFGTPKTFPPSAPPSQQPTPFPTLQPRAPTSQQAASAPFASLSPYLQPPQQPGQAAQQASAAPPSLMVPQQQPMPMPQAALPASHGHGPSPRKEEAANQRHQQEMWRKGLFSEVFDPPARGESPFHIPDLADIEAPDVDDLLMGTMGLGEGLDPFALHGSSPTCIQPPPGHFQQQQQQQPAMALTNQLHLQQQQQRGGAGAGSALQGGGQRMSPMPYFSLPHSANAELPLGGGGLGRQGGGSLLHLDGSQQATGGLLGEHEQQGAGGAGRGLLSPGASRKGGNKKVTSKKAAGSKMKAAAAAAVAAAKRARQSGGDLMTVVEWYTEEDPEDVPLPEALDPPLRPTIDPAAIQLSPAAALVAMAGPATAAAEPEQQQQHGGQGPSNMLLGETTCSRAAAGRAAAAAPVRVLDWLFGAAPPKRWVGCCPEGAGPLVAAPLAAGGSS